MYCTSICMMACIRVLALALALKLHISLSRMLLSGFATDGETDVIEVRRYGSMVPSLGYLAELYFGNL